MSAPPTLHVVVDDSPQALRDQLREAATRHGCLYRERDAARERDPFALEPLTTGDMLYRVGVSHASIVLEQLLFAPDVATFYTDPYGPHVVHDTPTMLLARCGVPVPRTVHVLSSSRELLRQHVTQLGGFPVVLKVPGRSLGVGVLRIPDLPTLFAMADLLLATHGDHVAMMSCVEPATHWRVIVVGEQVASAYINPAEEDDFRTCVDEDRPELFLTPPPEAVTSAAIAATHVLGVRFGGVDVLAHDSGPCYVLEVNFPCYFAHPWRAARVDVAGEMVRYLLGKSEELRLNRSV